MTENKIVRDKMPLVSVVVPIYNVELYLKECVASILSQTYKNLYCRELQSETGSYHQPYDRGNKHRHSHESSSAVPDRKQCRQI